jgi:S-adenosyl-L-methionine hydrolase (adenosine-forming)
MLVTLTSDFGWDNEGPGVMAATILGICPDASVVHLSHGVTPYCVIEGARQMECVRTIPAGVHVCVVDPGVGSERLSIVLDVPDVGYLVGPDNGVLMSAGQPGHGIRSARRISNGSLLRRPVSSTFHGRDVFSAIAGHLARGVRFAEIGDELSVSDLVPAPYSDASFDNGYLKAIVVHINRYGNCILNVLEEEIYRNKQSTSNFELRANGQRIGSVRAVPFFSSVQEGEALLSPDSYGRVALALNRGNISERFGLKLGGEIEIFIGGRE